jgi:leader peptidase (prepilin peptidase)/N-methyltransferase
MKLLGLGHLDRGFALGVAQLRVGPREQQDMHNGFVASLRGAHQGRETARVGRVDLRPLSQEKLDGAQRAHRGGGHQRRRTVRRLGVWIGAALDKEAANFVRGAIAPRKITSEVQRRPLELGWVLEVRVGAKIQGGSHLANRGGRRRRYQAFIQRDMLLICFRHCHLDALSIVYNTQRPPIHPRDARNTDKRPKASMPPLSEINAFLLSQPWFALFGHFVVCASLGSYFNLFAWRWPQIQEREWLADIKGWFQEKGWPAPEARLDIPENLGLALPASFCPACKTPIAGRYNIPVIGWLILRGKAACCSKPISARYPAYELLCGLLGVFAWVHFQNAASAWIFLLFALPLCMASQTDFESMMLPDSITGFILFSGLGLAIFELLHLTPALSFLGMAAAYASLSAIRYFGSIAFKKEAMGAGDPKFFAAIGAWIGPWCLPQALLIAAFAGLAYGLAMMAHRKTGRQTPVPFGPFLALGGAASFVWPNALSAFLG